MNIHLLDELVLPIQKTYYSMLFHQQVNQHNPSKDNQACVQTDCLDMLHLSDKLICPSGQRIKDIIGMDRDANGHFVQFCRRQLYLIADAH